MASDSQFWLMARIDAVDKQTLVRLVVPEEATAEDFAAELRSAMPDWLRVHQDDGSDWSDDYVRGDRIFRLYIYDDGPVVPTSAW